MTDVKLFNSPFEMELRILLLLSENGGASYSVDRIVALDFISCYASDFNLPFSNLHGHNNYKYGEISNRRMLVQEAVKSLVTKGLIEVEVNKGYLFSVTENGKKYAYKMKSCGR